MIEFNMMIQYGIQNDDWSPCDRETTAYPFFTSVSNHGQKRFCGLMPGSETQVWTLVCSSSRCAGTLAFKATDLPLDQGTHYRTCQVTRNGAI